MSTPFSDAIRRAPRSSWLDQLALSSMRAAESKYFPPEGRPMLTVVLDTADADTWETARVSLAMQNATAKIAHLISHPKTETTQSRRSYREDAPLVPRGQAGSTLFFGFPSTDEEPDTDPMFDMRVASLPERAVVDLVDLLPKDQDDDRALDAVLARRTTERSAVSDLVSAVKEVGAGLTMQFVDHAGESRGSILARDQAGVLEDSLRESREVRRTFTEMGVLDGLRTRRRLFYLIEPDGHELTGAIGPELVEQVKQHLGQEIVATVEEVVTQSMSGRRTRPSYSLIELSPHETLI